MIKTEATAYSGENIEGRCSLPSSSRIAVRRYMVVAHCSTPKGVENKLAHMSLTHLYLLPVLAETAEDGASRASRGWDLDQAAPYRPGTSFVEWLVDVKHWLCNQTDAASLNRFVKRKRAQLRC